MNREDFDPGPLADVDCHASGDRWTLVMVRDLRHPPAKVWEALTDPARLAQWAPFTTDRNLAGLGSATLTMIDGDTSMELAASVRQADPPRLLEYTWGSDVLRWELVGSDTGTQLTLRHTVEERGTAPKIAAGWHLCLAVAERLLGGAPIAPIRGADALNYGWEELNNSYANKLGMR
ncbi:MAG: SRPBCC family protein [Micromonosporaceae bacterium]